ncbi:hypothetical protein MTO96_048099 [Rhipicephalus appendiculatus]
MDHARTAQTVFGFDCSLDWRPTWFVNAFPTTRQCSSCGLVPPATAMLPCRHLLCKPCYMRGGCGCINRCPLDKRDFLAEDVVWSSRISKDSILNRRVRCWNVDNGCDAEGTASWMLEHFAGCRFHVVRCPSCGARVPHVEMADHLESCVPPCNPPREEQPEVDDNLANAAMEVKEALRGVSEKCASIEAKLESFEDRLLPSIRQDLTANLTSIFSRIVTGAVERVAERSGVEVRALLAEQMQRASLDIEDILAERERSTVEAVVRECNRMADAFGDKIADRLSTEVQTAVQTEEHADRSSSELKREQCEVRTVAAPTPSPARARLISEVSLKITKCLDKLREKETLTGKEAAKLLKLLAFSSLAVTNDALEVCESRTWTLHNWNQFRSKLNQRGFYRRVSPSEFFYGYRIFTELSFHPPSGELRLEAVAREGLYDDLVEWPVNVTPRVRFLHPTDESKNITLSEQFTWQPCATDEDSTADRRRSYQTSSHGVRIDTLERSGFTTDNRLCIEYDFVRQDT